MLRYLSFVGLQDSRCKKPRTEQIDEFHLYHEYDRKANIMVCFDSSTMACMKLFCIVDPVGSLCNVDLYEPGCG